MVFNQGRSFNSLPFALRNRTAIATRTSSEVHRPVHEIFRTDSRRKGEGPLLLIRLGACCLESPGWINTNRLSLKPHRISRRIAGDVAPPKPSSSLLDRHCDAECP